MIRASARGLAGLGLLLVMLPALGALQVESLALERGAEHADFSAGLAMALDPAVIDALEHGVPLTFAWVVEVRDARDLAPDPLLWEASGALRVDYRALSNRYSITAADTGEQQSYPDLARLTEALTAFEQRFPPLDVVIAAGRRPVLRFRIHLDIGELPPALRLPSYLDQGWRLDSGWVARELQWP